mmetsp:Transcript_5740/g.35695  ORF Transcript_5740/g.35695 Transcript_5740/m.35695 type:complete len:279 (-) Transcript_5740:1183-2019(-)
MEASLGQVNFRPSSDSTSVRRANKGSHMHSISADHARGKTVVPRDTMTAIPIISFKSLGWFFMSLFHQNKPMVLMDLAPSSNVRAMSLAMHGSNGFDTKALNAANSTATTAASAVFVEWTKPRVCLSIQLQRHRIRVTESAKLPMSITLMLASSAHANSSTSRGFDRPVMFSSVWPVWLLCGEHCLTAKLSNGNMSMKTSSNSSSDERAMAASVLDRIHPISPSCSSSKVSRSAVQHQRRLPPSMLVSRTRDTWGGRMPRWLSHQGAGSRVLSRVGSS